MAEKWVTYSGGVTSNLYDCREKGDAKNRGIKLNPIEALTGLVANAVLWVLRWGRRMSG